MGLYEHLPYANFHELNLDKIMELMGNIPQQIHDAVVAELENFPIPDGSITNTKLANYAVSANKILTNAVTNAKIANGAVTNTKIADLAISTSKLSDYAVTNIKIADDAVNTRTVEDGAITSSKLAAGSVTTAALNLTPQTLFSSIDAYSLTSGTTFQTVGDPFSIYPGLYLAILYVRKGLLAGTPTNQLVGARITADGVTALTNGLEIRQCTGPAASSHCQSVVIRINTALSLNMQGFQNSGQTNTDMKFYFQVLKLSD